jgi:ATP-dependent DNA helicase RecG
MRNSPQRSLSIDEVLAAMRAGESTDWEFKSSKGGLPGSLWETYSAMANSEGGCILLGATEKPDGVHLDGLTDAQLAQYQKNLWDTLNNPGKVSVNLVPNANVSVVEVKGLRLLAIRIPRATRFQRPVYLNGQPMGNTWRRSHEGDYCCRDEEVRRMFADAEPTPADHRILEGFSLEDLDGPSLAQYRQRFRAAKGEHSWLGCSNLELLEKLGGWRKDRQTGQEGITLAGLLMFGRDLAIRDAHAAPGYFVDYREKLDPAIRWTDRIYPDGSWEANLFQFYQRVWPKLASGLPTPFQMTGGMRRDETPAHESLREAFVNALIHADYFAPGGVVIERWPDRFVMENPGTLLVSHEQLQSGGVSECRNKALQQMFLMIGGGERAGSGMDKIRSGWRSRHWRAPWLATQSQPDRVRLTLPMVSLIPDDTLRALETVFGKEGVARLIPAELQALATAEIEGSVSNVRLKELVDEHPVEITRLLQRLCEQGFLVSDNRRRWTTYRIQHKELPLFDAPQAPDSQHKEPDSQHKEPNSQHKEPNSQHLKDIAKPVAESQRAKPEQVKATILDLCSDRFLTASELSTLLCRHSGGLQQRYIGPMVEEGLLLPKYAEAKNQPNQAYTSARRPAVK